MTTTTTTTTLTNLTCPHCAGVFAIAQPFIDECRRIGNFINCWSCPYCRAERGFGESQEQKLRNELADRELALSRATERARDAHVQRRSAERRLAATKGVVTRTKNRISKGVCPCCNRHFEKLQRHMDSKHPEYAGE